LIALRFYGPPILPRTGGLNERLDNPAFATLVTTDGAPAAVPSGGPGDEVVDC